MKRLLVANRGEIAVRVIRACRERGVAPLAVYSDADRDAPHVSLADAAFRLGPGPATESYLRIDRVLEAATALGADAVHPGYGFLSENAAFSEACAAAGLVFVGPSGAVLRALGDKIGAKRVMAAAGVPVVPGYYGDDQDVARLTAEAQAIGTPLLVKASAGGGGRGMRRVDDLADFAGALDEARREARASFGDDRVLLERLVARPRHVEVQIFGDTHGTVVHLFERECSVQRRHQKILEESPAPGLSDTLRTKLTDAAVAAGRAVGYVGAGTVEFLVDGDTFYFLEVNGRLQVEHPVTECCVGQDLVGWQLSVADGQPLPLAQEALVARGHAIGARVYAEDPATGFLPSPGPLLRWNEASGPGIRVDSGYREGQEVPPFYDALLAKVTAWGTDREQARVRLDRALSEWVALGPATNVAYLRAVLADPEFRRGATHIDFLAERLAGWTPAPPPEEVLLALAAATLQPDPAERRAVRAPTPWQAADRWRNAR